MPHYRAAGEIPRKRHTRSPWCEELMGEHGFSGPSSLLYHRRSPSAVLEVEAVDDGRGALAPNHPLLPRHLRPPQLVSGSDPVTGRIVISGNPHVTLCWWSGGAVTSPLYRNAVGDELAYVQTGGARVETSFGSIAIGEGDYLVIPAATTHRWHTDGDTQLLVVEAAGGHVDVPERYLTATGQLREGAPYSERDLRAPVGPADLGADDSAEPVDVLVRTRAGLTRHRHAHHPFDVVGWDGCLYPWALNILDFEPITGRIHQPPPVHQTFAGPRFVVCSFVPRLFDYDPDAVKIPYFHANVDSDELIFYSRGDFMSRQGSGIGAASVSLHPSGFTHGPQPGSLEASLDKVRTEEVAVMVDTFDPLLIGAESLATEDPDYWRSWSR
jgi:homogentisate 1,2-dioxygenase